LHGVPFDVLKSFKSLWGRLFRKYWLYWHLEEVLHHFLSLRILLDFSELFVTYLVRLGTSLHTSPVPPLPKASSKDMIFTTYDYPQWVHLQDRVFSHPLRQPLNKLPLIIYNSIKQIYPECSLVHLLTPMVMMMYSNLSSTLLRGVSLVTKQMDYFSFMALRIEEILACHHTHVGYFWPVQFLLFSICISDTLNVLTPVLCFYVLMETSMGCLVPFGQY